LLRTIRRLLTPNIAGTRHSEPIKIMPSRG
jgi:hypothetical protein